MNPMPLITLDALRHDYKENTVLETESLRIYPGTITGLAGPNGSGKSTLLNILGLVIAPSSGIMRFRGDRVRPSSVAARRNIALLTQEPYLLKRSVFSNVAYGLTVRKDTKNIKDRVFDALKTVGLPPDRFADRQAHQLSGGEARRVALAARLALEPDVLLLDEPTTHVDETSSRLIRNAAIQSCRQRKTTLVVSSHDREWLDSISDRVLTLYKGHIYDNGRINILYGPWIKQTNTLFEGAQSSFPIPFPPHKDSVAILPAKDLHLCPDGHGVPPAALSLSFRVAGVHLMAKHGLWSVFLKRGELSLVATLQSDLNCPVVPGQTIHAYYLSDHISFV